MGSPFQSLPPEVVLHIMELLWDLPTLGYLIQASHRCSAVFDDHFVQIIRLFISDLPEPLPRLLLKLSTPQDYLTREKFIELYTEERPQLSEINISLPAARHIIDTACNIQRCAQAFFETSLKRMNSLQPSHIDDTSNHRRIRAPKYDTIVGKRYQIAQVWRPSWIEEQKVLRILWQIHIYFTLKAFLAPETGRGGQEWTFLRHEKPSCIWAEPGKPREFVQKSELDCVYDFLSEVGMHSNRTDMRTETLSSFPPVTLKRVLASQPRPKNDELDNVWQRLESDLYRAAPALPHFLTRGLRHPYLQDCSFRRFERLGFPIWGWEKMVLWEMIETPSPLRNATYGQHRIMDTLDVLYTWRSIYSDCDAE